MSCLSEEDLVVMCLVEVNVSVSKGRFQDTFKKRQKGILILRLVQVLISPHKLDLSLT